VLSAVSRSPVVVVNVTPLSVYDARQPFGTAEKSIVAGKAGEAAAQKSKAAVKVKVRIVPSRAWAYYFQGLIKTRIIYAMSVKPLEENEDA
jgi:hypothetical protein